MSEGLCVVCNFLQIDSAAPDVCLISSYRKKSGHSNWFGIDMHMGSSCCRS
ncbi:Os02g0600000 [Oryza sativa Japonica Group]|uniref:Os02g0600000 protein n=1 Tax=Oryza sativa subsp. japonica TaxID=39947 RepID=Q6K5I3_ORYSJ|nr:unknown protein [Oryza sativa Japonica Group]BAH91790.1 Os02g0600000 [Oryza sativa Japonica Group]|eukprot:NP_001173061.1 Os02g0600000 [Oryza sativa Japonica Group]